MKMGTRWYKKKRLKVTCRRCGQTDPIVLDFEPEGCYWFICKGLRCTYCSQFHYVPAPYEDCYWEGC